MKRFIKGLSNVYVLLLITAIASMFFVYPSQQTNILMKAISIITAVLCIIGLVRYRKNK
ncbi:Uncharacterised protein [Paenibacillus polymyxa]|uniref:Uncharacterized protein n=1 Tax=Paenibacillus polymyxa TaxID=1406 RepID=A0A378XW15_PAEPO|nr:Uncharacterised protein [Paenibacillus polymyxa]